MLFSSLSSGSKQNCFYIEQGDDAILIDTGISANKLTYFMTRLSRDTSKIKAVFITHEHQDHIRGLRAIQRLLQIPVYLHPDSRNNLRFKLKNYQNMVHGQSIRVGELEVKCFDVNHDAAHTLGYKICAGIDSCMFLASDMGSFHEGILDIARDCKLVAVESNYDLEMLKCSFYPMDIKHRILSNKGHLSNMGCVEFLKRCLGDQSREVCLLHLSENNNTHDIVRDIMQKEMQPHFPHIRFSIALRDIPIPFIEI